MTAYQMRKVPTTRDLTQLIRGGEYTIEFHHEYLNEVTSPHTAHHPSHIGGRFGHFRHLTYLYDVFLETKGTLNNSKAKTEEIYDQVMAA